MQNDISLSFTATLHLDQHPVCILSEHTTGPMTIIHPYTLQLVELAKALGILIGPDHAWQEDRAVGLIDFHLASEPVATTFYFRHVQGLYRLYVRNGEHHGQGIYRPGNLPQAQAVVGQDPSLWAVLRAGEGGTPCTLAELDANSQIHLEKSSSGSTLAMLGIGIGIGGFLQATKTDPAATLTLNIIEREVDWLG
ncbi:MULTISPECIES: hypothetical protein [unclassified Pseudomonas]|uniref:hypothetical protein n=1 Tax=unclassified Pseudomonas TaxID=196821 RepID=UPI000BCFB324|nr:MULTISPECIES: hypothetical protein [unclassified Pseudomonas]PVZ11341.1 hypothetical protein F474_03667 [Pseudomonas sp. URIL14HWK12:I12]PVZ22339.1 hypothetical protein F470_03667 [Pseudomonas sp. URIL14HWK12:I10]PVZ31537.1 hypothetical protein F472_03704 [Pseudomonas sp. URIL14HWK12:I11]SNZ16522.1 hypothetical protein SAMN05660463_03343 [Pseudomonas sp. URIL14HWK12:I9]